MKEQVRSNVAMATASDAVKQFNNEVKLSLTNLSPTPYSRGGDIFMEGKPDMSPQNSKPSNPEHAENIRLGKEKLRAEWHKALTENELKNADTRSTIETAVNLGIAPEAITS